MKSRTTSKRRLGKQDNLPVTPFDEQARQLAEKRRKIQQEMEQCREIVTKAPAIKEQQKQIRQKEIEDRRSKTWPVAGGRQSRIPDHRHNFDPGHSRGPRLRRERSQGRMTFFMLLAALVLVLTWAYFTLSGPTQ